MSDQDEGAEPRLIRLELELSDDEKRALRELWDAEYTGAGIRVVEPHDPSLPPRPIIPDGPLTADQWVTMSDGSVRVTTWEYGGEPHTRTYTAEEFRELYQLEDQSIAGQFSNLRHRLSALLDDASDTLRAFLRRLFR